MTERYWFDYLKRRRGKDYTFLLTLYVAVRTHREAEALT